MNTDTLFILAAVAMAVALVARRAGLDGDGGIFAGVDDGYMPSPDGDTVPDQLPGALDSALAQATMAAQDLAGAAGLGVTPDEATAARNERAFLDLLAYAEGTAGPNGYRTYFGGTTFEGMADHPRKFFTFTNGRGETLRTSAAGRYQFLSRTWDDLAKRLELPDFGPASQDRAALELVRQRGALGDVRAGRISTAVRKCAPTWASLPGAGYAQPERKLSKLLTTYAQAGGQITEA